MEILILTSILKPASKVIICLIFILLTGCAGTRPDSIGQFADCPDKPNCVSTKSSTPTHKVSPLSYSSSLEEAKNKLIKIVESMPRSKIINNNESFLHVEFTSQVFRFIDDVEFYFNEPGIIHFRGASRIGHSDMGVNRDRVEEIRLAFKKDF